MEVLDGDRPVHLPRGRGRALLALLVLRAGEVVSTDQLIDWLWGEVPPPTAITALHGLISTLRKRLEPARSSSEAPAVLETHPPGYVLAIDRGEVDAYRFRRLLEEAAAAPAPERAAKLRTAIGLWRGPALADFRYEPFAQTDIAVLEELRMAAIEERLDVDLALGRHAELVGELEGLIAEQPLRERLRGQLMLALYRSGRQAEALEAYRELRGLLIEELGLEPGPVLRELEAAILRHDPALAAPTPAAPAPARKPVTVLCAELRLDSTPGTPLDPEALGGVHGRALAVLVSTLERYGGKLAAAAGERVVGVFGISALHEDDALRAAQATLAARDALDAQA